MRLCRPICLHLSSLPGVVARSSSTFLVLPDRLCVPGLVTTQQEPRLHLHLDNNNNNNATMELHLDDVCVGTQAGLSPSMGGEKTTQLLRRRDAEEMVAVRVRQVMAATVANFKTGVAQPKLGERRERVLKRAERERLGEVEPLGGHYAVHDWISDALRQVDGTTSALSEVRTDLQHGEKFIKHMVPTRFVINPPPAEEEEGAEAKKPVRRTSISRRPSSALVGKQTKKPIVGWLPLSAHAHAIPIFPLTAFDENNPDGQRAGLSSAGAGHRARPASAKAASGKHTSSSSSGAASPSRQRPSSARPLGQAAAPRPPPGFIPSPPGQAAAFGSKDPMDHLRASATLPVRGTARLYGRTPTVNERRSVSSGWAKRPTREGTRPWHIAEEPARRIARHAPPPSPYERPPSATPHRDYLRSRTGTGGGGRTEGGSTPEPARRMLKL